MLITCQTSLSRDTIYDLMFFDICSFVSFDSSKKHSASNPLLKLSYFVSFCSPPISTLVNGRIGIIAHLLQGL